MRGSITHRNLTSLPIFMRQDKTHMVGIVMLSLLALMAVASMLMITSWLCLKRQRLQVFDKIKRLRYWMCNRNANSNSYELILEKPVVIDQNPRAEKEEATIKGSANATGYDKGFCNPLFSIDDTVAISDE